MSENSQGNSDGVPANWLPIAWNGVRLCVPGGWQPSKIGLRYLLLETDNGPILELKWQPVKGRFSPRRQLKRLSTSFAKPLRKSIALFDIPAGWQNVLADFEAVGFKWQSESVSGQGAILYCQDCRTATLIQFVSRGHRIGDRQIRQVLESFSDHFTGADALWAMFDVRARIPLNYTLKTYRFDAGHFKLRFANRRQLITLHRWGPASLLLGQKGIAAFARSQPFVPDDRRGLFSDTTAGVCDGMYAPGPVGLKRLKRRLSGSPAYRRFRIWHLNEANRILGVVQEGPRPFSLDLFEEICRQYETVIERPEP